MARKTLAGWGLVVALILGGLIGEARAVVPILDQPRWAALAPEQKTILAPLEKEWDAMEAYRRKKWLGIAQRYPAMSPAEQASMQRNMRDWVRLAPEERKAAREKFKTLNKAAPEERQIVRQKWDEYNALPQEERDRLRTEASRRPQVKTPTRPPAADAPAPSGIAGSQGVGVPRSPLSPLKPQPQSPLIPPGSKPPAPKTQTPPD